MFVKLQDKDCADECSNKSTLEVENSMDDKTIQEKLDAQDNVSDQENKVLETSKNAEDDNIKEVVQAAIRNPPTFGHFTRFTIDNILSNVNNGSDQARSNIRTLPENYHFGIVPSSDTGNEKEKNDRKNTFQPIHISPFLGHHVQRQYSPSLTPPSPASSSSEVESSPETSIPTKRKASTPPADGPDHTQQQSPDSEPQKSEYSWLNCTRYKPPKLPRSRRKEGVKRRKLGRNPRVPFTQHQVACLERKFLEMRYLSSVDVAHLAEALCITEDRVKIWFQNRRARERRDNEGFQDQPNLNIDHSIQHNLNCVKETNSLPGNRLEVTSPINKFSDEKHKFKAIQRSPESALQMFVSPEQMRVSVPNYLLHGSIPSQLSWLRSPGNPFLNQRTLSLFNR